MKRFKDFFSEPGHTASAMLALCTKMYGLDFLSWESDTLELEILDDLDLTRKELAPYAFDRIHAIVVGITTDQYYVYLEAFEDITKAFNFQDPNFTLLTPCSPEEMVCAMWELDQVDEDYSVSKFSPEISAYVREALKLAGFYKSPERLKFAKYESVYDSSWVLEGEYGSKAREVHQEQQKRVSWALRNRTTALSTDLSRLGVGGGRSLLGPDLTLGSR